MTEAISRVEIEDILSSVRKLVSQDAPRPAGAAQSGVGKLVLTAELRVPPSADPDADADTGSAAAPADGQARDDLLPPEQGPSLLARIAQQATAEPRAADSIPPIPDIAVQDWLADTDIPLPSIAPLPGASADETDDPGLEATLARLEAMLAEPPLRPVPDAQATQAQAEPEPQSVRPPLPDASPDDAPVIDEAMLNQLVAHIVRQELQGELGEKITRAIRKLVRAEVARELALRKL